MRPAWRRLEQDLRVMACLGGTGPAAAPALIDRIKAICRFDTAGVLWGGSGGVNDAYFHEAPEIYSLLPRYAVEFNGSREREVIVGFDESPAATRPEIRRLSEILRVAPSRYYSHPLYGEIMGPAGLHHAVRLTAGDGRTSIGLMLGRRSGRGDFDDDHVHRLQYLAPLLSTILLPRPVADEIDVDSGGSAVLVVNAHGDALHWSPAAPALFRQMFGPRLAAMPWKTLPAPLMILLRRVRAMLEQDDGRAPPVWTCRTLWGRFRVQAYMLDGSRGGGDARYALHVRRFVPLALQVFDKLQSQSLTTRQVHVGALLARSLSERQVADVLGVALSTVIQHRRQLYRRLDVDSRAEFREALRRMP